MRAEGFQRERLLIAGAINSASLWADSFGTFLAEARKGHDFIKLELV